MTRKLIALALCLVMVMSLTIPGTFAIGMASDASDYTMTVEADVPTDSVLPDAADPVEENTAPTPAASELPVATETPATSAEPAATGTPVASAEPAASTEPIATEVPAASEQPVIMTQDQVAANYSALMAAATLEEMENVLAQMSEDELNFFVATLAEEQVQQINAKADALTPPASSPAPTELEQPDNRPIVYPAQNFTDAAPFLPPVTGFDCNAEDDRLLLEPDQPHKNDTPGLETSKTVSGPDENGQYTLTLEAWATGKKTIIDQETQVPTDIILVLDQSGSMEEDMTKTAKFQPYTDKKNPSTLYKKRNKLYVKRSDGSYAPLAISKTTEYTDISNKTNSFYWQNQDNLYHKCSDSIYSPVSIERSGWLDPTYTYTCTNPNCSWSVPSSKGNSSVPEGQLFQDNGAHAYTFSYMGLDELVTVQVPSNGPAPDWPLYTAKKLTSTSRISALRTAVSSFVNDVAEKANGPDGTPGTGDDINHRIAMVGFGSTNGSSSGDYCNTEIFIGKDQHRYDRILPDTYRSVFQNMNKSVGVNNINASIGKLEAKGATYINLGIEMGNKIFEYNPISTNEKRNRVMVVFTDGQPGRSGYESDVANSAIQNAKITKNAYGATVYSIGIFDGANAASPGNQGGNTIDKCNWFMQNLSSNNGTAKSPSYYLSAGDSDALNDIFKTISSNIESGGSSIQLGRETVMKDVISDYFQLPKGASPANIKAYTATYTGANTFAPKEPLDDAVISISKDGKAVSVTNFDYSENWVGTVDNNGQTEYRGKKLIVEIPIVVRDGFLGGNGVPTNGSDSGIYAKDKVIENFDIPKTDVQIPDITVTATDKNIYLTQVPTQKQLLEDATVQCGSVHIDFANPNNYGLEQWQNAFVSVDQLSATTSCNGKDDSTYTVDFTVSPKTKGTVTQKAGSATEKINVFKPEIEYKDSTINLGETADYETQNIVSDNVAWKHDTIRNTEVAMIGNAPALSYTYDPVAGAFEKDTDVHVTVSIGAEDVTNHVTFINNSETHADAKDHQFTVYVKSYTLTIHKTANAAGVFKFHVVSAENKVDMNVVIEVKIPNQTESVTIKNLPAGNYTVTEDTNWSWNFIVNNKSQTVNLAGETRTGSVDFVNTLHNKWLNDSVCVKNIPGMPSTAN